MASHPASTSKIDDNAALDPPVAKVRAPDGRMVSNKKANQPVLAWSKWKKEQEEKEARKMAKEERRAKGEEVSDDDEDTPAATSSVRSLFRTIMLVLITIALTGKFVTGSMSWGVRFEPKSILKANAQKHPGDLLFSDRTLAKYDGSDPKTPIYLAVDGIVYDVTEGRKHYGPGGSYQAFAAKDAARAFGTGCFQTHLTHDLRGLEDTELEGVEHWKSFFANSNKYFKVGRIIHRPIDPASPVPEHCEPEKDKAMRERLGIKGNARSAGDL